MNYASKALSLALKCHHGQTNKHDNEPYLLHVHRVSIRTLNTKIFWEKEEEQKYEAVAWLHDIIEDTEMTIAELRNHFPDEIVQAVIAITKVQGESNEDYYHRVKMNPIALSVKIADLHDNFGRNYLIEDEAKRLRMAHKYSLGISILTSKEEI